MRLFSAILLATLALAGCRANGTSTADAKRSAEELVRDKFGLGDSADLQTRAFVGQAHKGKPVICVTVDGMRRDESRLPTQYLISAIDPQRWLMIGSRITPRHTKTDMFAEWSELCPEPTALR